MSADFTNDQSRYQEVLFQRGKKVIDGELNDLQHIQRVGTYRIGVIQDDDAGGLVSSTGTARVTNFQVVPTATINEIQLQPIAGKRCLFNFRGYVFELIAPITFTTELTGTDRSQPLYFTVTEAEVSGAGDPSIVVAQLGETARRIRLEVTFFLGATGGGDPTSTVTAAEAWEGGTKSATIAQIRRAAAVPDQIVLPTEIFPRWNPFRTFAEFGVFGRGITFVSADGVSDARAVVDSATSPTISLVNLAVMMGPGNFDTTEDRVMKYAVSATPLTLTNAGDCIVMIINSAPRDGGTPSEATSAARANISASSPTAIEDVNIRVENWADWTLASDPPSSADSYSRRVVLCVRENATTPPRILFADGRILNTEFDSVTSGKPASNQIFWSGGSTDSTIIPNPSKTDLSAVGGDDIPYFRTQNTSTTGVHLLSAHLMSTGVYTRIYLADIRTFSGDGPGGVDFVELTGFIRTVNARWTGVVSAEWEADVTSRSSNITYEGEESDSDQGIYATAMRGGGESSPWDKDAWDTGNPATPAGIQYRRDFRDQNIQIQVYTNQKARIEGYQRLLLNGLDFREITVIGDNGAPTANALYGTNVVKAWGRINVSVTAGPVVVASVSDGAFGITDVVTFVNLSLQDFIQINFVNAFDSGNVCCVVTPEQVGDTEDNDIEWRPLTVSSSSSLRIYMRDKPTGDRQPITSNHFTPPFDMAFNFIAMGIITP